MTNFQGEIFKLEPFFGHIYVFLYLYTYNIYAHTVQCYGNLQNISLAEVKEGRKRVVLETSIPISHIFVSRAPTSPKTFLKSQ